MSEQYLIDLRRDELVGKISELMLRNREQEETIQALQEEINRLKKGDFTQQELQDLCHNLSEDDETAFKQGCEEYQEKLFGEDQGTQHLTIKACAAIAREKAKEAKGCLGYPDLYCEEIAKEIEALGVPDHGTEAQV